MYTDDDLFYTMRKTPLKGHSSLVEEKSVLNIRNRKIALITLRRLHIFRCFYEIKIFAVLLSCKRFYKKRGKMNIVTELTCNRTTDIFSFHIKSTKRHRINGATSPDERLCYFLNKTFRLVHEFSVVFAYAAVSSKATGSQRSQFPICLHLHPCFMSACSEGSDESVHMRSIVRSFATRRCKTYLHDLVH